MKIRYIFFIMTSLACLTTAQAQVKVGDNPGTINGGSALEIESTNKGLLMPRVALTTTTTWGLSGTAVAGMSVYNTSAGLTSSNTTYPAGGVGEYYWDGTGWVSKKSGAQSGADNGLTVGYNSAGNVGLGGTLSKNTTVAQGANTLAFTSTATSGTSHFTVDGSTFNVNAVNNNVGIGTASPMGRLNVAQDNYTSGISTSYLTPGIVITGSTNDAGFAGPGIYFEGKDNNVGQRVMKVNMTKLNSGVGFLNFQSVSDDGAVSGNVVMSVGVNGNVGIGTITPTQKLDVNGSARIRTIDASTSTSDVALVADADGVIKKKIDQVKGIFRSYLASDFAAGTANATIYKITNHNEIDDPNSDFNTSTNAFTAPITGLYRVTMTVTNTKLAGATLSTNIVVGVADASTNNWIVRFSIDSDYVAETNETGTANTFVGFVRLTQGQSCYFGSTGGIKILANPAGGSGTGIGTLFEIQLIKN
ncbi:hypothetical protein [Spirosoma lituiforme]